MNNTRTVRIAAGLALGIGFVAFTIVIFVRLALSIYTNNFANLTPEQFTRYPLRI